MNIIEIGIVFWGGENVLLCKGYRRQCNEC